MFNTHLHIIILYVLYYSIQIFKSVTSLIYTNSFVHKLSSTLNYQDLIAEKIKDLIKIY